jgi:arylsulfatase A-like enzyme
VANVPLLITGDTVAARRRVSSVVHHVDVMPTILELAAVALPADMTGRSLLPYLGGQELKVAEERPIFSETWTPFGKRNRGDRAYRAGPGLAVRVGDRKLGGTSIRRGRTRSSSIWQTTRRNCRTSRRIRRGGQTSKNCRPCSMA